MTALQTSAPAPTPRALSLPSFRRLWVASLISDTGDWMLFVALPLVVLQLSGSALGASIAFLLELGPAILLAPVASRLASRFDRRHLMVAVTLAQAAVLVPLLWVDSADDLPLVYVVIAAHACLAALFEPAKNSLLPDLVPMDALVSANALIGLVQNLGRLAGGPVGGILLAFGGLGVVVGVDIASYVVAAALIAFVRPPASVRPAGEADPPPGVLRALGLRGIRSVYVITFISSIAQGLFLVLIVLWAFGPLAGSEADIGVLRGIQAVGAIAAGLGIGLLARHANATVLTAASLLVFGVLSLAIWNLTAVTTDLWIYVLLFALVGAPGVIMSTGIVTTLQHVASPAAPPAVFAAMGLVMATGQAVGIVAAALADGPIGLLPMLQVQGCLYLAAGIVAVAAAMRSVRASRP